MYNVIEISKQALSIQDRYTDEKLLINEFIFKISLPNHRGITGFRLKTDTEFKNPALPKKLNYKQFSMLFNGSVFDSQKEIDDLIKEYAVY